MTDVAIIGAGPYGLSIAAHLKARGIRFRIFGKAMHAWLAHMPKGMHLKSEGFASGLYDPDSTFTLAKYCQREGIPYADVGFRLRLKCFHPTGWNSKRGLSQNSKTNLSFPWRDPRRGFGFVSRKERRSPLGEWSSRRG